MKRNSQFAGKPCKHWVCGHAKQNVETVDIVDTYRRCIGKSLYIGKYASKFDTELSTREQ